MSSTLVHQLLIFPQMPILEQLFDVPGLAHLNAEKRVEGGPLGVWR